MNIGSIFQNNSEQAVRLPTETRFPPGVKKVAVWVHGATRILEPLHSSWDSFFIPNTPGTTGDLLENRAAQIQDSKEEF